MKLAEIEKEALALAETDRASLLGTLLESLPADIDISDEEVERRDEEMDSGKVEPISLEEFVRQVGREQKK